MVRAKRGGRAQIGWLNDMPGPKTDSIADDYFIPSLCYAGDKPHSNDTGLRYRTGDAAKVGLCHLKQMNTDRNQIVVDKQLLAGRILAATIVREDARRKGFKLGSGGASTILCPVCQATIRYFVASANGLILAECKTSGCVRFSE